MPRGPRIVLIGSVSFSRQALLGLLRNDANVVGVMGLTASRSERVSDFARLDDVAEAHAVPFAEFDKVNEPEVVATVVEWAPDVLFVVGLSQMVKQELMSVPSIGSIGFHPTCLPEGRGRAPVVWLTLEGRDGAATFFVLEETADSGPIFIQEPFSIEDDFYAEDSIAAVRSAMDRALDRWIPSFVEGDWSPVPQDHERASFFGVRTPRDGIIDWNRSAEEIARLVRAVSRPYPGAYTYAMDSKVVIWRARVEAAPHRGVIGRILEMRAEQPLVQTGEGLLRVEEFEVVSSLSQAKPLRVGLRLGLSAEDEISLLKMEINALRARLNELSPSEAGEV